MIVGHTSRRIRARRGYLGLGATVGCIIAALIIVAALISLARWIGGQ